MIPVNKRTLFFITYSLIILLVFSPFSSVLANISWQNDKEQPEENFFESIGNALNYMQMDFLKMAPYYQIRALTNIFSFQKREKMPTGDLVEAELAKALQALSNFGATVLKDDKLVDALDDIIGDLMDKDDFTGGIQEHKDFLSGIIGDQRLKNILGEVIADYLKDEQMAKDIELFFSIGLDLIADKNIQAYIKETLAMLIENPGTSNLLNGIIGAVANIIYNTATDAIVDITSDKRVKEIIKDVIAIFVKPLPGMLADIIDDKRVKTASEDLLLLLLEYGPNVTAEILEDDVFQSLLSEIIISTVGFSIDSATSLIKDEDLGNIILGLTGNISEAIGAGLFNNIVTTMVDDFFKSDEFRAFVDPGFQYIISESRQRASDNTVSDSYYIPSIDMELNLGKEIAWGIAEVPPEIIYLGFFRWLVYGQDDLNARTYSEWAVQFTNLITEQVVDDLGNALVATMSSDLPKIIAENKYLLFEEMQYVLERIPYDDAADFLRDEESIREFTAILAKTFVNHIPFDYIAGVLRDNQGVVDIIQEVIDDLVEVFPLKQVGEFIKNDSRITDLMSDALPDLPLDEIADLIRHDESLWNLITEIANTFPVKPISEFLQSGLRADIIGYTIADLLLSLVADFIESRQLTDFIHTVVNDILQSFDDPFAKIILDSMARFFENEELAPLLAASFVGMVKESEVELHHIYREIVPKFFTRLITGK